MPTSTLHDSIEPIIKQQKETAEKLSLIQTQLLVIQRQIQLNNNDSLFNNRDLFVYAVILVIQVILFWWFKWSRHSLLQLNRDICAITLKYHKSRTLMGISRREILN